MRAHSEFQASLGCRVRTYLKTEQTKQNKQGRLNAEAGSRLRESIGPVLIMFYGH